MNCSPRSHRVDHVLFKPLKRKRIISFSTLFTCLYGIFIIGLSVLNPIEL